MTIKITQKYKLVNSIFRQYVYSLEHTFLPLLAQIKLLTIIWTCDRKSLHFIFLILYTNDKLSSCVFCFTFQASAVVPILAYLACDQNTRSALSGILRTTKSSAGKQNRYLEDTTIWNQQTRIYEAPTACIRIRLWWPPLSNKLILTFLPSAIYLVNNQ